MGVEWSWMATARIKSYSLALAFPSRLKDRVPKQPKFPVPSETMHTH